MPNNTLPLGATIFADQSCYINDDNRFSAVCYGLMNAVKILQKSTAFQYRHNIEVELELEKEALEKDVHITSPLFPRSPYSWMVFNERVVDNFLIGTFFEIVAKSFLLDRGFVVHKIVKDSTDPKVKALRDAQSERPIAIGELLEIDSFQDYKGNGRNGLKSLCYETLGYSKMYEGKYAEVLGFDDAINAVARYYRVERNMIHFPIHGASESQIKNSEHNNRSGLDGLKTIEDFITQVTIPLFNERNDGNLGSLEL